MCVCFCLNRGSNDWLRKKKTPSAIRAYCEKEGLLLSKPPPTHRSSSSVTRNSSGNLFCCFPLGQCRHSNQCTQQRNWIWAKMGSKIRLQIGLTQFSLSLSFIPKNAVWRGEYVLIFRQLPFLCACLVQKNGICHLAEKEIFLSFDILRPPRFFPFDLLHKNRTNRLNKTRAWENKNETATTEIRITFFNTQF